MNESQATVLLIKGVISELPADQREACLELIDHIRRGLAQAGDPVSTLAIALIGAEAQAAALAKEVK